MADGPKLHRRHGFYVLVMVIGWVLPPIAVLLRFGFGTDFFLNIFLTICGYIPGHGHNFYLQNIRNNHNKKRTPTWAARAGLIKDPSAKRKVKTQWASRYDERTPTRADGYQDDDAQPTPNKAKQTQQGQINEQPLLDRESFIESSSTDALERRSMDGRRDHRLLHNPSNHPFRSRSSSPSSSNKIRHPSSAHSHPTPTSTRNPNSSPFNSKKSNRHTYENSGKIGSASRSKTNDLDDPYFIRRASTINFSSNHHHNHPHDRKSTIHSPTSVKSFPAKLGLGLKHHSSNSKNRYDVRKEEETRWGENEARRSQFDDRPTSQAHPTHSDSSNHGVSNNDGLNHQF